MSTPKSVFIIGPGFIGWNVLELLVGQGHTVTGLVRRDSHAEQIKASGALAVKGDLDDHSLIVKHVLENDVSCMAPSILPHRRRMRKPRSEGSHLPYISSELTP